MFSLFPFISMSFIFLIFVIFFSYELYRGRKLKKKYQKGSAAPNINYPKNVGFSSLLKHSLWLPIEKANIVLQIFWPLIVIVTLTYLIGFFTPISNVNFFVTYIENIISTSSPNELILVIT